MTKIKKSSKRLIIGVLVLLIVAGGGVFLFLKNDKNSTVQPNGSSNQDETLNLNPPTKEEKQEAEDNKQRIANEQTQNQSTSGKRTVTPIITYAQQYGQNVEVGSYVSGVFEDGGECKATFTRNSDSITRKSTGVKEGNSTFCPLFSVPSSEFTDKGEWAVKVSYNSSTSTGNSEVKKLEVK